VQLNCLRGLLTEEPYQRVRCFFAAYGVKTDATGSRRPRLSLGVVSGHHSSGGLVPPRVLDKLLDTLRRDLGHVDPNEN
jgi:hypothetical protein